MRINDSHMANLAVEIAEVKRTENFSPLSDAKMSSITGSGYGSAWHAAFSVILRSSQIRMLQFTFKTRTLRVAHSACVTEDNNLSATKRQSSCDALVLNAYGTGLSFKNLGTASGRNCSLTRGLSSDPRPWSKEVRVLCKNHW